MDTKQKRIQDTIAELLEEADSKQESKNTRAYMKTLGVAVLKKLNETIKTIQANKVTFPKSIESKITNFKDFPRPVINIPADVSLRPVSWLKEALQELRESVRKIAEKSVDLPKKAEDAIPVKLVHDKEFYKAVADVTVQGGGGGGGGGTPKLRVTVDGQKVEAVPVVNPDGTNISGGEGGGGDASAANQDEQTAILTTIDSVLDNIKVDTEAIETATEAIQAGQLADGHNVTVDNASIPVTGTFWQATQPVSGTVTANLSATDNQVLDDILADTAAIETATEATQAALETAGGLVVNLGANNDVTVTGSVTADLGVNNDVTVTSGAITETNSGGIQTAVQLIDDTVFVDDADWTGDTSKHINVGGVYQSVPQTVTDGDVAPVSLNINGAVRTTNAGGALAIPNIDSYTHAAFNLAAGANQVLVASAASKQIWVYGIGFTVNVAGTVSFQDQDDTAITGVMQIGATGGMTVAPSGNFSMPIWKLATDKDLEVDVVTSELDGWIDYAIVSV